MGLTPMSAPSLSLMCYDVVVCCQALSTLGSSWSSAFHGLVSYVTPQSAQTAAAAAALTGEPKPEVHDTHIDTHIDIYTHTDSLK